MHVFLTGPVQIGKSTLITAALDQLQPERLGGFRTVSDAPAADPNGGMTETPENGNETPAPAEGSSDDVPPPAA